MKKFTLLFSAILFIALFIFGCDEINNLLSQDVDFTKTFNANVTNESFPQTKTDCVDLTTDKTFNDNKNKELTTECKNEILDLLQIYMPSIREKCQLETDGSHFC